MINFNDFSKSVIKIKRHQIISNKLVSFVGVDTQTDLDKLFKLNLETNWKRLEFSILYSENQKNQRYPDYYFCYYFLSQKLSYLESINYLKSIHLCGSSIEKYLNEDKQILKLCNLADRIQLNINLESFLNQTQLIENINKIRKKYNHFIILQQNNKNKQFIDKFENNLNTPISLLHDASGGYGKEIEIVEPPSKYPNYFVGYAGGINPENVKKIVKLIDEANVENLPYYIDMESGVRENNWFSIEKCRQVLNNCT